MLTVSASEARQNFAEIMGQVTYAGRSVTIERRGKPVARLVPIENPADAAAPTGHQDAAYLNAMLADAPVEMALKDTEGR